MNFTSPLPVTPGDTLLNTLVNPGVHVGQLAYTRDGRKFRFVKNGAVALAAGVLTASQTPVAAYLNMAAANTPIGAKAITVTPGAAVAPANTYAGGLAIVTAGAGVGQSFGVKSHDAIASATAFSLALEPDEALQV